MKPWRCVLPILLGLATAFAVGAEDRWLAVIGGTVFDGTGTVHTSATVLVKNDRIEAIGAAAAVPIPDAAERLDAAGKFVLPGLVDLHFHYDPQKTPIRSRISRDDEGAVGDPGWESAGRQALFASRPPEPLKPLRTGERRERQPLEMEAQ